MDIGYNRLVMEQQPAGDRRERMQRNMDIVESRRNGPQPSMRHDDDGGVMNLGGHGPLAASLPSVSATADHEHAETPPSRVSPIH